MSYLDKVKSIRRQMPAKPKEVQVTKETNSTKEASQTVQTAPTTTRNNPSSSGNEVEKRRDTVPRLPWELERLASTARADALPQGIVKLSSGLVPDLNRYVSSWVSSYVTSDCTEAERRLWEAHRALQGMN